MRATQSVINFCLKEYRNLKSELITSEQLSDFDIDYELRFILFLSAQIDGVQNITEAKFIELIARELEWSSVYQSLLLGKIEKQPSYQLSDIQIGKRFSKLAEIFYKVAYCMILIDGKLNTDEKFFIQNLSDHLFEKTEVYLAHAIELKVVDLDKGESCELDRDVISARAKSDDLSKSKMPQAGPKLSTKECLEQLNSLVGLKRMKEEVGQLVSFLKIQTKRKEHKLSLSSPTLHMVFTGAPGTGKTTVARMIANIYASLGILKKGHLVETDRSGLVGQYMGHTDAKTTEVINSALDGVLFIDEAYSLNKNSENDFGQEAIDTLVKRMEDDRDRLVVIVAGYGAEMDRFIQSNPGLKSRFSTKINFDNFKVDELLEIFKTLCNKNEYILEVDAEQRLIALFKDETKAEREDFGNGRFVRNLFERVLRNQAMRLSHSKDELTRVALMHIQSHDIQQVKTNE